MKWFGFLCVWDILRQTYSEKDYSGFPPLLLTLDLGEISMPQTNNPTLVV